LSGQVLGKALGVEISAGEIVQSNKVSHTKARAYNRLVTPAAFEGEVRAGRTYILVDDHVDARALVQLPLAAIKL
jgi:hypothetical protein